LLCEGLEATDVAGRPTEVFSPEFQYVWRDRWGLAQDCGFTAYFAAAVRHGTTPNGVYGLKIHWMHVWRLASWAGMGDGVLDRLLPGTRFVHITRRDRRAQALSWHRAQSTNEWWRIEGVANRQRNGLTPELDVAAVLSLERNLLAQDEAWEAYFRAREIAALQVTYEALVADYRGEVARVLDYLGLEATAARRLPPPRLTRQADAITAGWRRLVEAAQTEGAQT
jgi:LPS sulfotransferase NodH